MSARERVGLGVDRSDEDVMVYPDGRPMLLTLRVLQVANREVEPPCLHLSIKPQHFV